jgi:hypothetical protein
LFFAISLHRHCERSEAIQNPSAETVWIAHMGICCVKMVGQLFVRLRASSSSRPWVLSDGARRSGQDRPVRAAAKRLGLDVSEHAIRIWRSGGCGRIAPSCQAISGFEPFSQSGLRARSNSHPVVARWRLHQHSACGGAGSRGRDHSSLRHLKPCNPSVRPPGSAEADRSSADWFEDCERRCLRRRTSSRLPQSRRRRSRTSTRPRAACAPAPRLCACGRGGCWR